MSYGVDLPDSAPAKPRSSKIVILIFWTLVAWILAVPLLVHLDQQPPDSLIAILVGALVLSAVVTLGAAAFVAGHHLVGVAVLAAALVFVGWGGTPLSCVGCSGAMVDRHASVGFPGWHADAWDYWHVARETCAHQRVDLLARLLKTEPTAEAVARGYSRWMRHDGGYGNTSDGTKLRAVHAGCLQGFRDGRA